jgi:hypothetical protein
MLAAAALVAATVLPASAAQDGPRRPPSFADLDTDGDGVVSSDEFLTPPSERFAALDTDGDGVLTEEELEAGRPARGRGRR